MRQFIIMTSAVLALTACNDGNRVSDSMAPQAEMSQAYAGAEMQKVTADQAAPAPRRPGQPPQDTRENPSSQSYLAYRYNYGFALPVKAVASTAKSHVDICLEAGANICQVLNSNTSRGSADYVSASLSLRAEPKWLKEFAAHLQTSVDEAKGDMTHSGVSAEDLTRSILDTDARLKAQKTLRTRLEKLLETRDAKLPDLLALERELARVQGQIESATTTLNVLKKRVSMSVVDINYQTKQVAVTRGSFSPISRSLKRFTRNLSEGIASVIEFISHILPWLLLVILPFLWFVRWFWRRRKKAKA